MVIAVLQNEKKANGGNWGYSTSFAVDKVCEFMIK